MPPFCRSECCSGSVVGSGFCGVVGTASRMIDRERRCGECSGTRACRDGRNKEENRYCFCTKCTRCITV